MRFATLKKKNCEFLSHFQKKQLKKILTAEIII
jgi:hypothetical protein